MLDKTSKSALKMLYKKRNCSFAELGIITGFDEESRHSKYTSFLVKNELICLWAGDNPSVDKNGETEYVGYEITIKGMAYIEEKRKDAFLFWFPYCITTILAIISIIVSAVSICRQG